MRRGMLILTIVLIIIESSLIIISQFCRIPEWYSFVIGCVLIIDIAFLLRGSYAPITKRVIALLSVISMSWSVFSAYALPYWNSIIFRDIAGMEYPKSMDLDASLSREDAMADWTFALHQLVKVHPALLEQAEKKDSLRRIRLFVDNPDSISVSELYRQLQRIAASFHDAHTQVFPVTDPQLADFSSYGEIRSINGVKDEDFVSTFGKYISSETPAWTQLRISESIHTYDGLKLFGCFDADSVAISFVSPDAAMGTQIFRKDDCRPVHARTVHSLSSDRFGMYAFDDAVSCGILTLENCYYYTPAQRRKFNRGMRVFFRQMAERQCKRLVIDVRNNPGGNVWIAEELFRYFPVVQYEMGERYHRFSSFMLGGKRVRRNRVYRDLFFKGEVYVLTSLSTFSGAMHLADYLQGNQMAKVVGESPGNTPTCYTNITHFVLPHSKLSLTISTGKFVRTDGTRRENLLKPDIPCDAKTAYETLKQHIIEKL